MNVFVALDLLLREAQRPGSPLKGHDSTVAYLQRLGNFIIVLTSGFTAYTAITNIL